MDRCQATKAQLLEYVYDLLDESEQTALRTHVDACPSCQASLVAVRSQKTLLAAAARKEFPNVHFVAPSQETPVSLPFQQPKHERRRSWRRWAVAAAVLLTCAGLGFPAYFVTNDITRTHQVVADYKNELDRTHARREEAVELLAALPTQFSRETEELRQVELKEALKVELVGAATLTNGLSNTLQIRTSNLRGEATGATVTAFLADELGRRAPLLPVQPRPEELGSYQVSLPMDLSLLPTKAPLLIVEAWREGGAKVELRQGLEIAPPSAQTHLVTDRPIYRPGDTVYFRSLTLDRATLRPLSERLQLNYFVTPPSGEPLVITGTDQLAQEDPKTGKRTGVVGPDGKPTFGIGAASFRLAENAPVGDYTVTVRPSLDSVESATRVFPEQSRTFTVAPYTRPRILKKVDLVSAPDALGEDMVVRCEASKPSGEPLAQRPISASLRIDGKDLDAKGLLAPKPITATTNANGVAELRFKLPTQVEQGVMNLTVQFSDGVNVESVVKSLPLIAGPLQVEFFPEGGETLLAGVPNRVYFQARTASGQPIDLSGKLLEDGRALDVVVRTLHDDAQPALNQGRGSFTFTPQQGKRYALELPSRNGAVIRDLPPVRTSGVLLSVPDAVDDANKPLKVLVQGQRQRAVLVAVSCRGIILDTARLAPNETEARLNPRSTTGGVCRVTVYDEPSADRSSPRPLAERLIFRRPTKTLDLALKADKDGYAPGETAQVALTARDQSGVEVPAIGLVSVIDRSVLSLANDRIAHSMPAHFLLAVEANRPNDLENADILLSSQPGAAAALDLLLGTQGWRAYVAPDWSWLCRSPAYWLRIGLEQLLAPSEAPSDANRLLVRAAHTPIGGPAFRESLAKISNGYQNKEVLLRKQFVVAQFKVDSLRADPEVQAATARLNDYQRGLERLRGLVLPLVTLVLTFTTAGLLWRSRKHLYSWRPALITGIVAVASLLLTLGWRPQVGVPLPVDLDDRGHVADNRPSPWEDNLIKGLKDQKKESKDHPMPMLGAGGFAAGSRPAAASQVAGGAGGGGIGRGLGDPQADAFGGIARKPADDIARHKMAKSLIVPGKSNPLLDDFRRPTLDGESRGGWTDSLALFSDQPAKWQVTGLGNKDSRDLASAKTDSASTRWNLPHGTVLDREIKDLRGAQQLSENFYFESRQNNEMNNSVNSTQGMNYAFAAPLFYRSYAYTRRPALSKPDSTDTVYWHPVLILPQGRASFSYDMGDATTTYQATAQVHTLDGRFGAITTPISVRRPINILAATPREIGAGDIFDVAVNVSNSTAKSRSVRLSVKQQQHLTLLSGPEPIFELRADSTTQRIYRFRSTVPQGEAALQFEATSEGLAPELLSRSVKIQLEGVRISGIAGDFLDNQALNTLVLPQNVVKGSLRVGLEVYPPSQKSLMDNLAMAPSQPLSTPAIQNPAPSGPAAQSPTKPATAGVNSTAVRSAQGSVQEEKIQSSNYAASRAPAVEVELLQKAKQSLQDSREANEKRVANDTTLALLIWALTEGSAGEEVSRELEALATKARTSDDPYFQTLVANSLINSGRTASAIELLRSIAAVQKEDGRVLPTKQEGKDAAIETTALAALGWLRANPGTFHEPAHRAILWLQTQKELQTNDNNDRQTLISRKAQDTFSRLNSRPATAGQVKVYLDNVELGKRSFPSNVNTPMSLNIEQPERYLKAGANRLRTEVTGNNVFPYSLNWSYQIPAPPNNPDAPLQLTTTLDRTTANEGETVRLVITIENTRGKTAGPVTAVVGLPAGLGLPYDLMQLRQYLKPQNGKQPSLTGFTLEGRELQLNLPEVAPGQKLEIPVDLICRIPGEYRGPCSKAWMANLTTKKAWADPVRIEIKSRGVVVTK